MLTATQLASMEMTMTFRPLPALLLLVASLAGCATVGQNNKTEISSASKDAAQRWAFCVFRKAEQFASGIDDARVIAETASGLCEAERFAWLGSLGRDDLNREFMAGYSESLTKGVKNDAAALVLKRRAASRPRSPESSAGPL